MVFVAGRGGRARLGEVEVGVLGCWAAVGESGGEERLVGICGGREGSGGGSSLLVASGSCSALGVVW